MGRPSPIQKNLYRFIGGRLTLTQREKQDATDDGYDVFVKTVSRLDHGQLREVSRQRVAAPQPRE
jgi:hypothetical protein